MRPWAWTLVAVGVLAGACAAVLCVSRARRLHRLHVRLDAARAGLGSALGRRVAAAERIASAPACAGSADGLRAAVVAARNASSDREAVENVLGRTLAALDRPALPAALRDELAEAEQLLALARRVHNDAVRDTLGLRSRRLVRRLHLAGSAPMPAYFDIADPEPDGHAASGSPYRVGGAGGVTSLTFNVSDVTPLDESDHRSR